MAKLDHLGRSPGSWCLPALRPKLLSYQTHFQAKPGLLAPGFTQQTSLVAVFPLCSLLFGDQSSLTWRSLGEDQKADHLEETSDSLKLDLRNFLRSSIMTPFFPSSKSQPASHLPAHTLSRPPQAPSCVPMSDGYFPSVDSARMLTGQRGTS